MSDCLDLVLLKPDLCTMEERVRLTCAQLFLTIIKALVLVLTLTSPRLSMLRSSSNVTDELLLLLLLLYGLQTSLPKNNIGATIV